MMFLVVVVRMVFEIRVFFRVHVVRVHFLRVKMLQRMFFFVFWIIVRLFALKHELNFKYKIISLFRMR